MARNQRKLAAIMFTDMVGYTLLGQRNEALSLALVEEQRRLVRSVTSKHGGREIKTIGDAFLVEFKSALQAVRCAYDIQRSVREHNISMPEEGRFRLRVGIHLGDVVESNDDISGDAVNVASRIEPLAENGGICLTRQVYDQVLNKFDLPLQSLGPKSLKHLDSTREIFRVVLPWEEQPKAGTRAIETSKESKCAWCSRPIVGEPIAFESKGETLHFDTRECLTTYRKVQNIYGDSLR